MRDIAGLIVAVVLTASIIAGVYLFVKHEVTHYEVGARCGNCGNHVTIDIPKGTSVSEFVRTHPQHKCSMCGCSGTLSYN